MGVDRSAWGWCQWGENITIRYRGNPVFEDGIHLGDVWRVGDEVRLQVCGSRIPCFKMTWRCGQKDKWLAPLATSGRVGVYLRALTGGRVRPGDEVAVESRSGDAIDVATVCRAAWGASLKTKDTLDLLANHEVLLRMNRWHIARLLASMDDKANQGRNAWKGWRDLRVDRVVDEGAGIKSFYLRTNDIGGHDKDKGKPLANYLPGQFLTVRLPNDGTTVRSWTISDWPVRNESPPYYRLNIKNTGGEASSWMHQKCAPGTILQARSPAGRFVLDWQQKIAFRQIYISAGIGITPIIAMMKAHDGHPNYSSTPALWIHVARDGASVPQFQRDEVPRFEGRLFQRFVFFTQPRPEDAKGADYDVAGRPGPEELKGIIAASYTWQPLGTRDYTMDGKMSTAYVCGPAAFETAVRGILEAAGLPPPSVHSESFAASGAAPGDLERARVTFSKSGKKAAWTKEEPVSLLELAESVGLAPDYGCRVGQCGSCAAKLVCGKVSGGVQPDGTVLACSAVPASDEVVIEI